jgi:hypothetical protein
MPTLFLQAQLVDEQLVLTRTIPLCPSSHSLLFSSFSSSAIHLQTSIVSQSDTTIFKGDTVSIFSFDVLMSSFPLTDSSMHPLPVFNAGHMLITCSIMNCSTGQKLYAHT